MATTKEEKLSEHEEKILCHWKPPRIPVSKVYRLKRGICGISSNGFKVRKVSQTVPIQGEYTNLQLLTKEEILGHMHKRYEFLHIGMVQVAVKPLTMEGLNCSVLVCLRDGCVPSFGNSLLAAMESSLSNGPIYFDIQPDKVVSLSVSSSNILDKLTLNFCTSGLPTSDKGGQGRHHAVVVYHVYYKVLVGGIMMRLQSGSSKTDFVETNLLRHDKLPTLKTSKWSDLQYPRKWITQDDDNGDARGSA